MAEYREERDSLGTVRVPADALYGAQTQRAVDNFRISGLRMPRPFIRALALIKAAAAEANAELGLLEPALAEAIKRAAEEVAEGRWDDHFPVDVFQTGSGTSTNMNANEVIAHRASELLTGDRNSRAVHPNDHVNLCQSSNDVIPSSIHVSACIEVQLRLLPALKKLEDTVTEKASQLDDVIKTGRTHLMDAMPIRLSQVMQGWACQIRDSINRINSSLKGLRKLAIGGTAVGTGINAHPEFASQVVKRLSEKTGIAFEETDCHFSAQATMDAVTELSGHLKTTASSVIKIANDVRWMSSGPLAGLSEITLPALQPGSSIMPGKVNPVVCEATIMACVQTMGNDVTITISNSFGNFELNVMLPLIAYNVLQSITLLTNSIKAFTEKVINGFTVNKETIETILYKNPIIVTALTPVIGYDKAAEIAKRAYKEGRTIKDVVREMTDLTDEEIDRALDVRRLTERGIIKS